MAGGGGGPLQVNGNPRKFCPELGTAQPQLVFRQSLKFIWGCFRSWGMSKQRLNLFWNTQYLFTPTFGPLYNVMTYLIYNPWSKQNKNITRLQPIRCHRCCIVLTVLEIKMQSLFFVDVFNDMKMIGFAAAVTK